MDSTPFDHVPAMIDLQKTNTVRAWHYQEAEQMDFSREDAADDLLLNEILWKSIRGPNSAMPPPVRAAFVFAPNDDDHDHDGDDDIHRNDDDDRRVRDDK